MLSIKHAIREFMKQNQSQIVDEIVKNGLTFAKSLHKKLGEAIEEVDSDGLSENDIDIMARRLYVTDRLSNGEDVNEGHFDSLSEGEKSHYNMMAKASLSFRFSNKENDDRDVVICRMRKALEFYADREVDHDNGFVARDALAKCGYDDF